VLVVGLFNLVAPTGWQTGLIRIEDILIGASVSLVVGLVFWPRRPADLLRVCTIDLYRALASATRTTRPSLAAVRASERRAHAAFAQYLDDRRGSRAHDAPWSTMLGVAGLGRTGLRFIDAHRVTLRHFRGRANLDASTADMGATWHELADALAQRVAPSSAPSARRVAKATRSTALDAIKAADVDDIDAVVAATLWRDWLVEQALLLRDAADAVGELVLSDP